MRYKSRIHARDDVGVTVRIDVLSVVEIAIVSEILACRRLTTYLREDALNTDVFSTDALQ